MLIIARGQDSPNGIKLQVLILIPINCANFCIFVEDNRYRVQIFFFNTKNNTKTIKGPKLVRKGNVGKVELALFLGLLNSNMKLKIV